MRRNIIARALDHLKGAAKEDIAVAGNGLIAIVFSIITLLLSIATASRAPRELVEDIPYWWLSRHSYGSQMIFIGVITLLITIAFITKKNPFPFERLLLLISLALMVVSGLVIYEWGLEYDLSMFWHRNTQK